MRLTIEGDGHPPVSGVLDREGEAESLLVLAHGAGAPMTHPFMAALAAALVAQGVAVLRYNFAYADAGRRRPDPPAKLQAVAASALALGRRLAEGATLFAGGKSMGGRMTSALLAGRARAPGDPPAFGLAGLVFFGFPLHPPGRPGTARADHLDDARIPMLFHQGTRDRLAEIALVRAVVAALPSASLHVVDDADHSFAAPKRTGRSRAGVLALLAERTSAWMRVVQASAPAERPAATRSPR